MVAVVQAEMAAAPVAALAALAAAMAAAVQAAMALDPMCRTSARQFLCSRPP